MLYLAPVIFSPEIVNHLSSDLTACDGTNVYADEHDYDCDCDCDCGHDLNLPPPLQKIPGLREWSHARGHGHNRHENV